MKPMRPHFRIFKVCLEFKKRKSKQNIYPTYTTFWHGKIYFDGIGINVKYILADISHFYTENECKKYLNYTLFAKIYFIYFDIYDTYIFFLISTGCRV